MPTGEQKLEGAIEEFLVQMSANGRRPSSVSAYSRELRLLAESWHDRPLKWMTADDVSRFLVSPAIRLRRNGNEKAVATQNRTKAVIRTFFVWCERTERVERNPASLVAASRGCDPVVSYMSRQEVRRFLAGIERSAHPLARRDHALFSMIAYTGLRLSEVTRAVWGDLDVRGRRLLLRSAKGGRRDVRHVPRRLLRVLLNHRRRANGTMPVEDSPIFPSRERGPLSARAVQYRFAFWLSRVRIRRRMSVHSLRHTFATLLYRATGDLLLVGRALGHRDIRTTQRYAHLEDRSLAHAVNRL